MWAAVIIQTFAVMSIAVPLSVFFYGWAMAIADVVRKER